MTDFLIPNIEEKRKCIEALKSCDFKTVSEQDLIDYLKIILTGQTIITSQFNPDQVLYRGILYSNKPNSYNDLIYPPKNLAKQNRANREGDQMFYCSNLKKVPFYELFLKAGDKLVISTWVLKKKILLNNIGYTKSNLESLGTSRELPFRVSSLEQYEGKDENDLVADFLSEAFCKKVLSEEKYYYNLTNLISEKFLFADVVTKNNYPSTSQNFSDSTSIEYNEAQQFPGIHYPTIQNNGIAENFAFKREAIDDNILEFAKVEYVQMTGLVNDKYEYKILDVADEINGSKIIWKNLNKQWLLSDDLEDINFVEENGDYEAYTIEGDKLEPV